MFDDLRNNATLKAMLVYAAAEDPARIPLDRVGLARAAKRAAAQMKFLPLVERPQAADAEVDGVRLEDHRFGRDA